MKIRDEFESLEDQLAICGVHIKDDSFHVGLYWYFESEKKVFHFQNGNYIPIENFEDQQFNNYYFNSILDFPSWKLASLCALAELISENKMHNLIFNRNSVVYEGGKFEFNTGNYLTITPAETMVNCGVFVVALLNTFDYKLLDWSTWPNVGKDGYLDNWLNRNFIPKEEWSIFYNQAKELRGKHVLVAPSVSKKPAIFSETNLLADKLVLKFDTK